LHFSIVSNKKYTSGALVVQHMGERAALVEVCIVRVLSSYSVLKKSYSKLQSKQLPSIQMTTVTRWLRIQEVTLKLNQYTSSYLLS